MAGFNTLFMESLNVLILISKKHFTNKKLTALFNFFILQLENIISPFSFLLITYKVFLKYISCVCDCIGMQKSTVSRARICDGRMRQVVINSL